MNEFMINELIALGCVNRKVAQICIHVFLELTEVKKYWNVKYHHNNDLNTTYLTGSKTKSSNTIIFIPVAVADQLSFNDINKYFDLSKNNESVYLVIVDSDSTTVYYQITNGIGEPSNPVTTRTSRDQRKYIDSMLRKHTNVLEEAALCELTVDLSEIDKKPAGQDVQIEEESYSD